MAKKKRDLRPPPEPPRQVRRRWVPAIVVVVIAAALGIYVYARQSDRPKPTMTMGEAAFVSDTTCESCHQAQYQSWRGSHHAKAMQVADASTVLGNFDEATFESKSAKWRFFKRDGHFFVRTGGSDGKPADFEIKYTFGVDPLQQYLVAFPGGRLQTLTVAWDSRPKKAGGQRWFEPLPQQPSPPDDPFHWKGRYQNWNLMCAQCHMTNFRKGYDPKTDTYSSTWSAVNVGCQACHGAGERHLEWARTKPTGSADKGLLVDFHGHDARHEVDACAACHSRRASLTDPAPIEKGLLDNYFPLQLDAGAYHPDGQQLGEVYAYGSFRQSRMYQMGVRCTDCHRPHDLQLKEPGNAVCLQCHQAQGNSRFPSLRKMEYDTPAHHFHKMGSTGAACVACHMPSTTYMGVHERPDHAIRVPRPDLTVALGVPNACTRCHADRSAGWAVQAMETWYGKDWERRPHFAEVVAAARAGDARAGPSLAAIAGDGDQPAIVRATALGLLHPYPQGPQAFIAALHDADPVVRAAAVAGMGTRPPEEKSDALLPLLDDPVRAVRIEAGRALANAPRRPRDARKLEAAIAEYEAAQMATADMPSSRFNLGTLYADLGQRDRAEQAYLDAIRLDPSFLPARFNLANLYNEAGRNEDAERVLRDGLARAPQEGELYYSLGLVLAEEKKLQPAADALGRAATLLPRRARVQYDYGLALQQLGRLPQAETALVAAARADPRDGQILYAVAVFYTQQKAWAKAQDYAEQAVALDPKNQDAVDLLGQIMRAQRR